MISIAAPIRICESPLMRCLALLLLAPLLGGCVAKAVVETAATAVTLPVKAASRTVDLATTSQSEADEKRGRKLRKEDERRGREARLMAERCRKGKALPADDCGPESTRGIREAGWTRRRNAFRASPGALFSRHGI
jgi:hypothetical protein